MNTVTTDESIKTAVREAYGSVAKRFIEAPDQASTCGCDSPEAHAERETQAGCCGEPKAAAGHEAQSSCCDSTGTPAETAGAASRFYLAGNIADLPESVTGAALGCGNPTAIAKLRPGEVVLDLGSGGGIDCFLAAKKVGPEGRVIGLDMTPDMIRLARRNARKIGATNVDFRFGEMEDIPLPAASVDIIISNCVINLSPDKDAVFQEAYRVLRPGGRMSISDIVVDGALPPAIRSRVDAWAGCIAGALDEEEYLGKLRAAGFEAVEVESREYMQASKVADEDEIQVELDESGLSREELDFKVASVRVIARKPG